MSRGSVNAASRSRSTSSGKNAKEALFLHALPDALGKQTAEAGQGDGRAGAGKVDELLINADRSEQHADDDVGHENARRSELRFVDEKLPDDAQRAADQKSFEINHHTPQRVEQISSR